MQNDKIKILNCCAHIKGKLFCARVEKVASMCYLAKAVFDSEIAATVESKKGRRYS